MQIKNGIAHFDLPDLSGSLFDLPDLSGCLFDLPDFSGCLFDLPADLTGQSLFVGRACYKQQDSKRKMPIIYDNFLQIKKMFHQFLQMQTDG